ncbi:lipoprotein, partial [human gut metagenome]
FIFQDGMRDGIALLAVQFKNDSVAQTVIHIQSAQHYSVELADNDSLGIKCIKGYFMLNEGGFSSDAGSLTTLKLMFVNKIRLIRMHPKKVVPVSSAASSDSAKVDTARKTRIPGPSVPARPDGALAPPTSAPVPMPDKPIQMTSN